MFPNLVITLIAVSTVCAIGGWRHASKHPDRPAVSTTDKVALAILCVLSGLLILVYLGASEGGWAEPWVTSGGRGLQVTAVAIWAWSAGQVASMAARWLTCMTRRQAET